MTHDQLDAPFEFKFDEGENTFEGFASVYDNVDLGRDVVKRGAFDDEIRAFKSGRKVIPILWQHDPHNPIGLLRDMADTRKGLFVKGEIFPDEVPQARTAHKLIREKAITGLSIGYSVVEELIDRGKRIRNIVKAKLYEVSTVTFPMNVLARVTTIKAEDIRTKRDFENGLVDMGFSRNAAKSITARGFNESDARDEPDRTSNSRDAIEANAESIKALRTLIKS